jgi:hypothetical protein
MFRFNPRGLAIGLVRLPAASSPLPASAARSRALRVRRPSGALRQIRPATHYTQVEDGSRPLTAGSKEGTMSPARQFI